MKKADKITSIFWTLIIVGFLILMLINVERKNIEFVVYYGVLTLFTEINLLARLITIKLDNLENKIQENKKENDYGRL